MKWFEDIFTKSKLMLISGIVSIIIYLFLAVTGFIASVPIVANCLFFAILSALLLFCYKRGETSCQKALLGAVLGALTLLCWIFASGVYGKSHAVVEIIKLCMTVSLTVIFMNHLLLQMDHKGDKKIIVSSQIVLTITIFLLVVETIALVLTGGMFYDTLTSIAFLSTITMITCMESRIHKYKARRFDNLADGTWTEEERRKSKKIFQF